jgi:hypothetical protein
MQGGALIAAIASASVGAPAGSRCGTGRFGRSRFHVKHAGRFHVKHRSPRSAWFRDAGRPGRIPRSSRNHTGRPGRLCVRHGGPAIRSHEPRLAVQIDCPSAGWHGERYPRTASTSASRRGWAPDQPGERSPSRSPRPIEPGRSARPAPRPQDDSTVAARVIATDARDAQGVCGLGVCGPERGAGARVGRAGLPNVRMTSSSASSTPASRRTPSVMRSGVG